MFEVIFNVKKIYKLCAQIIALITRFSLEQIALGYTKDFLYILTLCCNIDNQFFYRPFNASPQRYAFGTYVEFIPEYESWIKGLKVGDRIDAVKIYGKFKNWSRATVSEIEEKYVGVMFDNTPHGERVRKIDHFDFELEKLDARSKEDFEWREGLKIGDEVDYYYIGDWKVHKIVKMEKSDNEGQSKVIKTIDLEVVTKDKEEETMIMKFAHEEVSIHCPKIKPKGTFSKFGLCTMSQDHSDTVYSGLPEDERYGIIRLKPTGETGSWVQPFIINEFGKFNGFEMF